MSNRERGRAYASILIPREYRWIPLEHVSAPEYVPSILGWPALWRAASPSVQDIVSNPRSRRGRARARDIGPHHPRKWIDIVAKEHEWLNDYGQASEAARQWARTRHRCTPEEVSRMEAALSWPSTLSVSPPAGLPADAGGCTARIYRFRRLIDCSRTASSSASTGFA